MADRSVAVHLKAGVQDYLAGMRQAKAATSDFASNATKSATQHKAQWSQVGQSVSIAGLAIAAGVGFAVSRFADFDAAMSAAGAATRATSGDLELLREAALQAGQDTQFSATEAAQGITELAKAGVSTADILNGGLAGALDLAAAGQLDVAKAAEIAATAMTQFKLSGDKLPHVADLLAAGAGKAQGSVEDMGMALKQSGLVAQQYGLSVEETTGALAAFASAGLIGSDAGTSFKSMLQRLTPQSAEAAKEMERLGISAFDAQGNFVGLESFAGNLQTALSGLTSEQRNTAMATIFGSDAVRAAAVLYDQGAAGVAKWTANVNDAGFAQEQARRLTDNWKGDLERLSGALDTAFIKSGSGANDALRGLTQGLEGAVNWFNELSPAAQSSVVYIGAATAAVALLGGGALIAVPKLLAFNAALNSISIGGVKASTALKTLGLAAAATATITVGGSAMQSMWMNVAGASDDATKSLEAYLRAGRDAQGVTNIMKWGFQDLGQQINHTLNPSIWHTFDAAVREVGTGFGIFGGTVTDDAIAFFQQMDKALAGFVESGRGDQAAQVFNQIAVEAQRQGYSLQQVQGLLPQYAAALDQAGSASAQAADGTNSAKVALDDYARAAESAKATTDAYIQSLKGINSPVLDARAANRQWEESIRTAEQALKENEAAIRKHGKGSAEAAAAARNVEEKLDGMAQAAIENLGAMAANGASQGQLQGALQASRGRLEEVATRFFGSKDAARAYVDQVLRVPPVVNTQVNLSYGQALAGIREVAAGLSSLRDKTVYIRTATIALNMDSSSTGYNRAQGGLILGPGTTTSDSIPALLSNREYVVKAAAVEKYGVAFMDRVNSMRFADGGLVGAARASAPSAATTSGPPAVAQNNHYYGVTDAQEAADRARRDLAWSLAAS